MHKKDYANLFDAGDGSCRSSRGSVNLKETAIYLSIAQKQTFEEHF
jgi:hypothetical protein